MGTSTVDDSPREENFYLSALASLSIVGVAMAAAVIGGVLCYPWLLCVITHCPPEQLPWVWAGELAAVFCLVVYLAQLGIAIVLAPFLSRPMFQQQNPVWLVVIAITVAVIDMGACYYFGWKETVARSQARRTTCSFEEVKFYQQDRWNFTALARCRVQDESGAWHDTCFYGREHHFPRSVRGSLRGGHLPVEANVACDARHPERIWPQPAGVAAAGHSSFRMATDISVACFMASLLGIALYAKGLLPRSLSTSLFGVFGVSGYLFATGVFMWFNGQTAWPPWN